VPVGGVLVGEGLARSGVRAALVRALPGRRDAGVGRVGVVRGLIGGLEDALPIGVGLVAVGAVFLLERAPRLGGGAALGLAGLGGVGAGGLALGRLVTCPGRDALAEGAVLGGERLARRRAAAALVAALLGRVDAVRARRVIARASDLRPHQP